MNISLLFKSLTKTERYIFGGALTTFSLALIFQFSHYFYANTVAVPVESNEYIEGVVGQPTFINPVLAGANDVDRDLSELMFSSLLDLANRYTVSDDGKTWNIFLKNDLVWSDNKPLTSDDVVFTIETIQNFESRSPLFMTWQGVVINRISELEIEFNLRTPYAFFADNLKELRIIPKHIFSIIPAANLRLSNYNLEPIGSGPYKIISYEKRKDGFITSYNLEINPNYPLEKPLIKNFIIKFFSNTSEIIKAFNSKKIDGFGELDSKNINDLKLNHQIIELNVPRYYAIFLNANSNPVFSNKEVKQALNFATDRKKIIENVFNGKASAIFQPILPGMPGYDASTEKNEEFSLERANEILNTNGWVLSGEGAREKKSGKITEKLEFDIVVPQISFLTETINIIKDDWQKIGVKLNPIILNPTDITNEVLKTRDYQMIIFGNILKNSPDIFSFWHSSERFYPGLNLSLYDNKKADSLLESIRKDVNEDSRKENLKKLQLIISDDRPAIFLFSPTYLYAAPKNFGGLKEKLTATPSDRFENVNQWYLETQRVFK